MKKKLPLNYFWPLITSLMYGIGNVLIQNAYWIAADAFAASALLLGGLALAALWLVQSRMSQSQPQPQPQTKMSRTAWRDLVLLSSVGTGLPIISVVEGFALANPLTGALLMQGIGIFAIVFLRIFRKEQIRWNWVAIGGGLCGIYILWMGLHASITAPQLLGDVLILLGAMGLALGVVIGKSPHHVQQGALKISTLRVLIASGLVGVVAFLHATMFHAKLIIVVPTPGLLVSNVLYALTAYGLVYYTQSVTFQTVSGQAYAVLSQTTFGFSLIGAFLLFREVPSAPQWVAGVVIVLTSGVGALGNENAFDALLARGRRRLLSLLQSLATKIVHWAILAGQPLLEDIVRQAQSTSPVPTASTANIEEIVQRLEATLQRLSELEEAQAISTPPLLISSVQTALPSPKPTSALITDGAGHTARVTKASDEVIETTWSFAKISVAPVDTEAMEVSSDAGCVNVQYREGTYTAFMPFTQAATSPQRLIHIVRAQVQHDLVISIEFPRSIDITPIYEGETTLIKGAVITGNNNYQALSFGTAKNLGVVEEGDKHVLTVQVTLPRDAYYSVAMVTAKDAHQAHLLVEELGREDFRPEMARTAKVWRTWLDQLGGNFSEEQKRALLTIRGSFLPTGEVVASPEVAAAVEAMGKGRPTKYLQIAVIAAQCLAEAGLIEAMTFVTWLASVIEEKQDIPMNEIYQLLQFLRDNWMYQKFNYPAEIATPIFRSLEAAYMR